MDNDIVQQLETATKLAAAAKEGLTRIPTMDAQALLLILKEQETDIGNLNETVKNLLNAYKEIKAIYGDGAKVVGELVRCENCKRKGNSYECRLDRDLEEHGSHRTAEYDDWFCADGVKKDD